MNLKPLAKPPSEHELLKTAGEAFWNLCTRYGLTQADAGLLLGVSEKNRSRLGDLERKKEIPPEALMRVSQLFGIHKSLRILYPENREIVYGWMKQPLTELGEKSPLEYLREHGPAFREFALVDLRGRMDRERVSGPF
ncbi:MAG: helix-turn-helix transcriptional regulator [Rhodocyclaceae bacterium]|jgi:hypothetical protein|nr:helix-turn-helix transcriptional regulator [Rhodocyclaceae bacterium]